MPIDSPSGYVNNSQEISLKSLIFKLKELSLHLRDKWVYILSFGLIGAILGLVCSYTQKPLYTATTTFVLESGDSGGGLSQYAGLASMIGVNFGDAAGGGIFQGDNILELYKSRKMLEKTLLTPVVINGKSQNLIETYIDFNELRKSWQNKPNLLKVNWKSSLNSEYIKSDSAQLKRLKDSVLGKVVEDINKNYLTVSKPDKKLSIIKVEVKSANEQFSKELNEKLVKNVNEFYIQTKTKKSLDNIAILQHKVDSVRTIMNGAIYTAAAAIDATPNLNPTKLTQRNVPTQKAQFSAEANKAILTNLIQSLELGKISLLKETPLIQTIDMPIYPLTKTKLGRIKGTLVGGILASLIVIIFLLVKVTFKKILSE